MAKYIKSMMSYDSHLIMEHNNDHKVAIISTTSIN